MPMDEKVVARLEERRIEPRRVKAAAVGRSLNVPVRKFRRDIRVLFLPPQGLRRVASGAEPVAGRAGDQPGARPRGPARPGSRPENAE